MPLGGRVTEELLGRVPDGKVIAVDGSRAMVEQAKERLGDDVEAFAQDLLELKLDEQPVDAILSTATFHWIGDHEATLFARLYDALAPGGRLSVQCGGLRERRQRGGGDRGRRSPGAARLARPWNFATPEETTERLRAAGFTDIWAWLQPWPVEPPDPREYFETIILGSHLERLPIDEQLPFVDDVLSQLGHPVIANYVRLNILARRR